MTDKEKTVKIAAIQLEFRNYFATHTAYLEDYFNQLEFKDIISLDAENLVETLVACVLGERIDEIKYPSNWWEAFKERWFPRVLLKRFPVDYENWKLEIHYPTLNVRKRLDPKATFVLYSKKSMGYPHYENENSKSETD
jgi:hypothetical protein